MADATAKLVLSAEDQTKAAFDAVKQSIGGVVEQSSALKASLLGIGTSLGLAALVGQFKDVVHAAASLDDLAAKTGSSVENLGKLRQQAKISGGDFEGLTDVMVRLSRALTGADDESKAAGAALARLGLNAEDLRKLDPADALKAIVVELNKYADSGGKSALASDLLGKTVAQHLPVLKDWAANTQLTAKVTAEQAREAKDLEKQMNMLEAAFQANKKAMLLGMVPAVSELIAQFDDARRATGGFLQAIVALANVNPYQSAGKNIADLQAMIEKFENSKKFFSVDNPGLAAGFDGKIEAAKQQLKILQGMQRREALAGAGGDSPGERARFFTPLGNLNDYVRPAKAAGAGSTQTPPIDSLISQLEKESVKTEGVSKQFQILEGIVLGYYGKVSEADKNRALSLAATIDANKEQVEVSKKNKEEIIRMSEEADKMKQKAEELAGKWRDMADPTRAQNRLIAEGLQLLNEQRITIAEFNTGSNPRLQKLLHPEKTDMEFLNDQLKEGELLLSDYKEIVKRINGELKTTKTVGDEVFAKLSSGLEDAITSGKNFGDVLRSVGNDLVKIFVRSQVTEPLGQAAKSAFSNVDFGGVLSGFKSLFGFATGGDFTVGGGGGTDSQLVAFRATPGESVSVRTPGQQSTGGAVIVNQDIRIDGGTDRGWILKALEATKQQTIAAVSEARQRGGVFSAAMGR